MTLQALSRIEAASTNSAFIFNEAKTLSICISAYGGKVHVQMAEEGSAFFLLLD